LELRLNNMHAGTWSSSGDLLYTAARREGRTRMPVGFSRKWSLYMLVRKLWNVHSADSGVLRRTRPMGKKIPSWQRIQRMQKLRIVRDFGWKIAHEEAVSPRPPISLDTSVARTHMYTRTPRKVWEFVVGRVFCRRFLPRRAKPLTLRFATFSSL
jgi:hypothetical protein